LKRRTKKKVVVHGFNSGQVGENECPGKVKSLGLLQDVTLQGREVLQWFVHTHLASRVNLNTITGCLRDIPLQTCPQKPGANTQNPNPQTQAQRCWKEMSEHGIGWPSTCSTGLSPANPSGTTHRFKKKVKISSAKRISKAGKATSKASFSLRKVLLLV